MSYLVLARKYRPLVFADIVAQEHVSRTLVNAIAGGRISHAYLFSGPRGVGKTSTARILARAVNCTDPVGQDPCNKCDTCIEITRGSALDVIEIDGASNRGIDEIRDLRERVGYSPSRNRYKIYIIDEVHMLTQEAFNALLKTLEEPPSHVIFIFATTAAHKVPPTILSRCQRFDFKAVSPSAIQAHLAGVLKSEGIGMPEQVLEMLARKAGGAMRDALSLLDQVIAFCGGDYTVEKAAQVLGVFDSGLFIELGDLIASRDSVRIIDFVERLVDSGVDLEEFFQELAGHYRNLIVLRLGAGTADDSRIPAAWRESYEQLAGRFEVEDLVRSLHLVLAYEETFKRSNQQRICLELLLIRLALLERSVDIAALLGQLNSGSGGSGPSPSLPSSGESIRRVRDSGQSRGMTGPSPRPAGEEKRTGPRSAPEDAAREESPAPLGNVPAEREPEGALVEGALDIEKIRAVWPRLIDSIKSKRVSLAPALGALVPVRLEDKALVVNISRRLGYYLERLSAPENMNLVSGILRERLGQDGLSLRIEAVDEPPEQAADKNPVQEQNLGTRSFEQLCRTDPAMGKINEFFDPELI